VVPSDPGPLPNLPPLFLSQVTAASVAVELRKLQVNGCVHSPRPLRPLNNIVTAAIAVEVAPPASDLSPLTAPDYQQLIAGAVANGISAIRVQLGAVQWTRRIGDAVIKTNLDSCFNMTKQVCDGMVDRGWGPHHQHRIGERAEGCVRPDQLFRRAKAGMQGLPKRSRSKSRRKGVTREHDLARLHIGSEDGDAIPKEVLDLEDRSANSDGTTGQARRGRRTGRLSVER